MKEAVEYLNDLFYSREKFEEILEKYYNENTNPSGYKFYELIKEHLKSIHHGASSSILDKKAVSKKKIDEYLTQLARDINYVISQYEMDIHDSDAKHVVGLTYDYLKQFKSNFRPPSKSTTKATQSKEPSLFDVVYILYSSLELVQKQLPDKPKKEDEAPTDISLDKVKSKIIWKKTDTDLLELITALYESGAINNTTTDLTRKDAIKIFSEFLNIEIKDAESKLSKATNKKKEVASFLSILKKNFEDYAQRKDNKLDAQRR